MRSDQSTPVGLIALLRVVKIWKCTFPGRLTVVHHYSTSWPSTGSESVNASPVGQRKSPDSRQHACSHGSWWRRPRRCVHPRFRHLPAQSAKNLAAILIPAAPSPLQVALPADAAVAMADAVDAVRSWSYIQSTRYPWKMRGVSIDPNPGSATVARPSTGRVVVSGFSAFHARAARQHCKFSPS